MQKGGIQIIGRMSHLSRAAQGPENSSQLPKNILTRPRLQPCTSVYLCVGYFIYLHFTRLLLLTCSRPFSKFSSSCSSQRLFWPKLNRILIFSALRPPNAMNYDEELSEEIGRKSRKLSAQKQNGKWNTVSTRERERKHKIVAKRSTSSHCVGLLPLCFPGPFK